MPKFEVRVGTEFEIEDSIDGKSRPNHVTVVMVNDKDTEKSSRNPHLLTVAGCLVGLLLTLGTASALAYGMTTGDYSVLKAFPELIQQLLSAAISLMAKKP